MCACRLSQSGWRITITPLDDIRGEDVLADTQRMNDAIERAVRETPAQYTWVHKRFKVHPDPDPATRGPGFYD